MAEFDLDTDDLMLAELTTRLASIRRDLAALKTLAAADPAREAVLDASLAEVNVMLAALEADLNERAPDDLDG
ncbi:MAG: hypothetical protein JO264_22150 [Acidisphaera sp.]|nr:hypothetical protein [Acidisphaera sp.]